MAKKFTSVAIATLLGMTLRGVALAQSLPAEVATLQSQVATLQSQVATVQSQMGTLQSNNSSFQSTLNTLRSTINTIQSNHALLLDPYVTVDPNAENGLAGPHVIFHGANVHIESGSGRTVDTTGLGNLLIGYDQDTASYGQILDCRVSSANIDANRSGSHNLIVGDCHQFIASGGLAAGVSNKLSRAYTSVTGFSNAANGDASSVSGGWENSVNGSFSSISGGSGNAANGFSSSVSGGGSNTANGDYSSILGGSGQSLNLNFATYP